MNKKTETPTPGPWHAIGLEINADARGDGDTIATCAGRASGDGYANANIIAAAPAMLAALQELIAVYDLDAARTRPVMTCDTPLSRAAIDAARAAIAAAEGSAEA